MNARVPHLLWDAEAGYGYCPARAIDYGISYWEEFRRRDQTDIGRALTASRVALVRQFAPDDAPLVDVGIGGGAFVEARPGTLGTDVCYQARKWLAERGSLWEHYRHGPSNLAMWDVLEHLPDAAEFLLESVVAGGLLFAALPIFGGRDHALRSRHFKPGEHLWYWTEGGFASWLRAIGFDVLPTDRVEEQWREDILRVVARRVP